MQEPSTEHNKLVELVELSKKESKVTTDNFQSLSLIPQASSNNVDRLLQALCSAILEFGEIKKDKVNPHFKSAYASLDAIIPAVRNPLAKHGLMLFHSLYPSDKPNKQYFIATLVHAESGQFIRSLLLIPTLDTVNSQVLQAFGSNMTYLRRYTMSALLCLSVDEDDDGNSATISSSVSTPTTPTVKKVSSTNEPTADKEDFMRLKKVREELGLTQDEGKKVLNSLGISQPIEIPKSRVEEVIQKYKEYANK